ncbi:MAG: cell division topological specificity factor MinE [Bacillota bacterium]|jgi:cell division topological specificity factor|nr:cell division topological specificity factor MinE [Bacillota bacterium]
MLELLQRVFGREASRTSKHLAKERLRLVLMHDRMDISPQLLEHLRADLLKVITEYLVIDEGATEITLHRGQGSVALVANIPVLKMRRLPTQ